MTDQDDDAPTPAPEHLDLRKLPKVDVMVDPPERYSQTLLRHGNTCKRAAYLYVRHHGGMPAHALDRGTIVHIAQARTTEIILEQFAIDPPAKTPDGWAPPDVDYAVDEGTAKLALEEVINEHPELTLPLHERDACRVMMSHLANGFRINPATVVAVERKFVLDLGPFRISGIMDLARILGTAGKVNDYKTQYHIPSQGDYEATFQGRLYAVLLVYGSPVTDVPCGCDEEDDCDRCKGRGTVERLDAPIGEHLTEVEVGEVFPRYLSCRQCGATDRENGVCAECGGLMELPTRTMPLARIEIDALRRDIQDQCEQLHAHFLSGEFPAVSGNHCKRCPCEPECPLPPNLRRFAGTIQTDEQAKEAAEWWQRSAARVKATYDEIKSFCKINGPLRFGVDQLMEFGTTKRWNTNWPAIERGAKRAAEFGEPFEMSTHRRQQTGTAFKVRTLSEVELAAEREEQQ